jgi:hypothetical protein
MNGEASGIGHGKHRYEMQSVGWMVHHLKSVTAIREAVSELLCLLPSLDKICPL